MLTMGMRSDDESTQLKENLDQVLDKKADDLDPAVEPDKDISFEKLKFQFERLRAEISHETTMIAQRTNWFVSAQAFMFAALAIAIPGNANIEFKLENSLYFGFIPWLAIFICLLSALSALSAVSRAREHQNELNKLYQENQQSFGTAWLEVKTKHVLFPYLNIFGLPTIFSLVWLNIVFNWWGYLAQLLS